jgi:hypothetical protein
MVIPVKGPSWEYRVYCIFLTKLNVTYHYHYLSLARSISPDSTALTELFDISRPVLSLVHVW